MSFLLLLSFRYVLFTHSFIISIAECNNALIYPGLGFGAILAQSKIVSDTMLIAGAKRLAALSPALTSGPLNTNGEIDPDAEYNGASLLPDFGEAPRVNFEVAVTVAVQAVKEGSASVEWVAKVDGDTDGDERLTELVRGQAAEKVWVPIYPEYVYDEHGERDW